MGFFSSLKEWFGSGGGKKGKRANIDKRFNLLNRTGQGSMSRVWRAQDRQLGRIVCLKILDKEKTAKFEARFQGIKKPIEGEVCMTLNHPNIVRTFEYGTSTKGEPYLVMELVDGMGLNYLVETRNAQLNGHRRDYLAQLAEAIGYLHEKGYMHRDLCPRNVMVTKDGVVKLIDFGLTIPNTPDFCKPGNRTGTPNYLAPEVIRRTSTDQRVDLFALGVTAYEVFLHELPWEKAQSLQTLQSIVNSPGKDPREIRPDLDDATIAFLTKAIERHPNDRFQTAEEFRDAVLKLPKKH